MPSDPIPAIAVDGLTRRFGDLVAVDHIDFSVAQGEVFGFLGPNGAGKTTTISMLTTLLRPTEGNARLAGHDVERNGAHGKTLGGATVATLQGTVLFVFAPLVGFRLTPLLVLQLWPIMFLGAFALASMGVAMAARMRSIESFQMINQFVMLPLIFLSGIFFPLQGLPAWMDVLVRLNPVSYAVDPLRRLILQAQGLPPQVMNQLSESGLGLAVGGREVSVALGVAIVAGFGIVMNVLAMWLISIRD